MFKDAPFTNHKKIDDSLFINCNHTALHSCWFLQDLLDYFSIDKGGVTLLIHRPSGAESEEIKKEIMANFKKEFIQFLVFAYGKTEDYANTVINNINKYLNPILCRISKSYVSFFLFDDYVIFSNYANKVRERIENNLNVTQKTKKILFKYLLYLSEYYKV